MSSPSTAARSRQRWSLGRTYDPVMFEKLKVRGLSPNPVLALEWYKKAEKAGITGAKNEIKALSAWMAK